MGRSNRIVSQSMCNWLLLMVFVMQFVVYLLGKTVWGIFSSKPAELYYYDGYFYITSSYGVSIVKKLFDFLFSKLTIITFTSEFCLDNNLINPL